MKKTTHLVPSLFSLPSGAITLCFLAGALVLLSPTSASAFSATWLDGVSGLWSGTANWQYGTNVADGAGFSANTQQMHANATITLDSSRTIGNLAFQPNGKIITLTTANGSFISLSGANPALIRAVSGGTFNVNVVLTGSVGAKTPDQSGTVVL